MKRMSPGILNNFLSIGNTLETHPIENCLTTYDIMYYIHSADKIFHPLGMAFYALDLTTKKYLYLSSHFEKISGCKTQTLLKEGMNKWESIIHPNDREDIIASIEKDTNIIYKEHQQKYHVFTYTYRILSSRGNIKQVRQQSTTYRLHGTCNILEIGFISETELLKKEHTNLLRKKSPGILFPESNNNFNCHLSEREKEIDILLKKGYNSKQIGKSLNISIHTVSAHRRKINKKKYSSSDKIVLDEHPK
jgi:DNA-binding CsgD family transcriptional regulator